MAGPARYDLSIYQGDDFSLTLRLREQNPDLTLGAYIDLTGATAKAEIRATAASATVLAEFTATVLDQTVTPGGLQLSLTHDQTAGLAAGVNGVWDIQVTQAGLITTYLHGNVTVTAEVTRA